MRWLKCDLQMQTPADRKHWKGEPLVDGKEQEIAYEYVNACYEAGLDVVGITEHNFLNKDFLPYLEIAFKSLQNKYERKITLFPGFEFEAAGVGRGVHILCLFEPGTPVEKLDSVLTECGIVYPRTRPNGQLEKSDKNLKDILKIVQGLRGGIVIMPHATSNDGIFDNESISEWVQQDQFTNPDLLAIEVPKPVHLMSEGYKRLLTSGENCQEGWRRERPVAVVMSSDNKMLLKTDGGGRPVPNSIGYRYSWIKMSNPSIESLRQAFLDPDSRIKLPEDVTTDKNPSLLSNYPYIKSIKIEGAEFLDDQEIHFSPSKNSLIGGRGSGKSTVLEYLRLSLGKENEGLGSKAERIKKTTNNPEFKATVEYCQKHGVDYTLELTSAGTSVINHDVQDQTTLLKGLPALFFSQQQLNKITEADESGQLKSTELLLGLVDGFVADELKELREKEEDLLGQIRHKQNIKILHDDNSVKITKLKQEVEGLTQQWKARQDVQGDSERHSLLKKEQTYIDSLASLIKTDVQQLKVKALEFDTSFSGFIHDDTPNAHWFKTLDLNVKNANQTLKDGIAKLVEQHDTAVRSTFIEDNQWISIKDQLDKADSAFQEACALKGILPEDVQDLALLATWKSQKEQEVVQLEAKNKAYNAELEELSELKKKLEVIWGQQFESRKRAADKANKLAVYEGSNKSFVTVELRYQGDKQYFLRVWEEFGPKDKRAKLARDWCDLIENSFDSVVTRINSSIWTALYQEFESSEKLLEVKNYIDSNANEWNKLITLRVPDAIDITLYRSDGSEAGKVSANTLSDGQRNTAVLALLLAQDGGPLIIDQPEDELDSNFVFNELIPMIRRMKTKRQLIFATHNANLPVNGDADLLYAFEAKDGRGVCKAQGGLDREEVTSAVLDIMEGSEKAFTRRREKYGF